MDPMFIAYFEETEELLQKAEECLIRLESEYSSDDINELFRIAHSIKGSSQMIGYDQIGNLTHKIEDLLDFVRKGRVRLDSQVLRLCFEGMDDVKKMFESKKEMLDEETDKDVMKASGKLREEIDTILKGSSDEKSNYEQKAPKEGIVNALKKTKRDAGNRVYISIFFRDDAPMVQALLFMIFNHIKEIGSLIYSNVSDDDIYAASANRQISSCVMILNTDMEASELYPYFEMMYVEKVTIVDISDSRLLDQAVPNDQKSVAFFELFFDEYKKLHPLLFRNQNMGSAGLGRFIREQSVKIRNEANLVPFNPMLQEIEQFYDLCPFWLAGKTKLNHELTNVLRREYMRLLEKVYGYVRGKIIFKIVKAKDRHFIKRLNEIVERMDRTLVRKLFIDVSGLKTLDEHELRNLIKLKRQLNERGISIGIIAGIPLNKRLVNILDSIQTMECFRVFATELDAALSDL